MFFTLLQKKKGSEKNGSHELGNRKWQKSPFGSLIFNGVVYLKVWAGEKDAQKWDVWLY